MKKPFDLIILGAGPAGLAAFQTAGDCGLAVALVDENPQAGGRIYKGILAARAVGKPLSDTYGADGRWAAKAIDAVQTAADPTIFTGHTVVDVTRTAGEVWQVHLLADTGLKHLQARRILVATGAKERPFAFPGWTLPGVMTAGSIQTLMKDRNCLPDCPVVLAGSGPLLLLPATLFLEQGVNVSALLDTTPRSNVLRAARFLPGAMMSGATLWQGVSLLRRVTRAKLPLYRNVTQVAAHGTDVLGLVSFTARGTEHQISTPLLVTHLGIVPDTQLTRLVGCTHHWSPLLQAWAPDADGAGQTSHPSVSVAGDATGSNGALAARNAGHLAALDAACKLGAISTHKYDERARPLHADRRRSSRERRFLNHLFAPAPSLGRNLPDETLLCRCEEVSFGTLREMTRAGIRDFDQFKAVTRCGMGPCQGRICADMATLTLAEAAGIAPSKACQMKVRAPLKPIPLGAMAKGIDIGVTLPGDAFVYTSDRS